MDAPDNQPEEIATGPGVEENVEDQEDAGEAIEPETNTSTDSTDANMESSDDTESSLHYVALGDSLSEGIGDQQYEDGFVERTSEHIENIETIDNISYDNYGVSGYTSAELLDLVQNDTSVQESIAESDFISITIGGNDLNGAFMQNNGFNADNSDFEDSYVEYFDNSNRIISEIENINPDAAIYFFDLYNPYYVSMQGSDLNNVFSAFNEGISQLSFDNDQSEIIEIESLFLYDHNSENSTTGDSGLRDRNHPYLYENDWFHPNEEGYQLMTDAFIESLSGDFI